MNRNTPEILHAADYDGYTQAALLTSGWGTPGRVLGYVPSEMCLTWIEHTGVFAWMEDAPSGRAHKYVFDGNSTFNVLDGLDVAWRIAVALQDVSNMQTFRAICTDVFNMTECTPTEINPFAALRSGKEKT